MLNHISSMLDWRHLAAPVAILGLSLSACINGDALTPNRKSSGLIRVLHADGPATDRAAALALYGRFIGDWDADIVTYTPDGVRHHGQGEIHFGWILEGRAIQDVWMIPQRTASRTPRRCPSPATGTVRQFESMIRPSMRGARCRAGASLR
jgi:hypothetical protein